MRIGLVWAAVLTLLYALALGSFDPVDLAIGAAVSAAVVVALRRVLAGGGRVRAPLARIAHLPSLVAAVLRDMTVGTWQVASIVLGIRPLRQPGIVAVPFGERSDASVIVTAFLATLSPGEFLVEIDWEERLLLFHVVDAGDPDGVREKFDQFYRRHQQRVVP